MAADIVAIELSLPEGDVVTLWAPLWREDGEEWEAFLGDDDNLFAFPDVAQLVAFVRTAEQHDLIDHPAWRAVPGLAAYELIPEDNQHYDLVGVPELVAGKPDSWTLEQLAEAVAISRSIAEVCGLEVVDDVLDSAPGFEMAMHGPVAFTGRDGKKQWQKLSETVARRWDEVLDAIQGMVATPAVHPGALEAAQAELDAQAPVAEEPRVASAPDSADEVGPEEAGSDEDRAAVEDDPVLAFWSEVGIDPIRIVSGVGDHYTLRCYVDDTPVFLGRSGQIHVCNSPKALARHLAENDQDHDLRTVATWPTVVEKANAGELRVRVDEANSYVLTGLDEDLAAGPETVDPAQLDLAVELLTDADEWAGGETVAKALVPSDSLGWLVRYASAPDPNRLAPTPPFDEEVARWRNLVAAFEERLRKM